MKNLKAFIVYGAIIVICIAAFGGYLIQKNVATSSGGVGYISKSETEKKKHVDELMKEASAAPDPNPVVGVGRGKDYAAVTRKAIENAGGLKDIVKKGSVVLIKPNLCTLTESGDPRTTDYRVVSEVVRQVREYGASKIIIAEGSIMGDNAFDPGYMDFIKYGSIKNVKFFNINGCKEEDCYKLKPKKSLTEIPLLVPKIYMDADVVIGIAKLKTHSVTKVSLSLKNSIGVTPSLLYGTGGRSGLHDVGIDNAIVDLNRIRKPDFAIIDGIVGGEGDGPMNNTPVNSQVIFAGKDLVALDTAATKFMGYKPGSVTHLKLAAKEKLGIWDLKKIKIVGADLNKIKMRFSPFDA